MKLFKPRTNSIESTTDLLSWVVIDHWNVLSEHVVHSGGSSKRGRFSGG